MTARPTGLLAGQTDPAMRELLQRKAEQLRAQYGHPASAPQAPAAPAGEAAERTPPVRDEAVSVPGTPPVVPRGSDGVPGPSASPPQPGPQESGGEARGRGGHRKARRRHRRRA